MTDKAIQEIIDHFNRKNGQAYIASHPIGDNVDYGVVWTDIEFNKLGDVSPY